MLAALRDVELQSLDRLLARGAADAPGDDAARPIAITWMHIYDIWQRTSPPTPPLTAFALPLPPDQLPAS